MQSMSHLVEECQNFVPFQYSWTAGHRGPRKLAKEDYNGQLVRHVFLGQPSLTLSFEFLRGCDEAPVML